MRGHVRPGNPMEADQLAPRLRQADLAEIRATVGGEISPLQALQHSADWAWDLRSWIIDGELAAMGGVRELKPGVGLCWLVGSDATFTTGKWPFARLSRGEMDRWNRLWPLLTGQVWAANTAHVRWMTWCGFTLFPPAPFGPAGELFHRFERRAHVH